MYQSWNLDPLYTGFDDPAFLADYEHLPVKIAELVAFAQTELATPDNIVSKLERYVQERNDFARYYNILRYCSLVRATNTENPDALSYMANSQNKLADLAEVTALFTTFVAGIDDLDKVIDSSPLLAEHRFYLHEIKANSAYQLSTAEEVLYERMRLTGSNAWYNLHGQLTSTLAVDITLPDQVPETMTLTQVRNLASDKDPAVRSAAYHAELLAYTKIEKPIAAALNAIKGEALTTAKARGHHSVLAMTLHNSRMDQPTLDALIWTMKESLPLFSRYFKHKAKLLGHEGALPFHDLFAPVGTANMTFSKEAGSAFMIKNFTAFDPDLGAFAKHAIENAWVDWDPRKGKVGGAFCANLHNIGQSRVLMNYDGSFSHVLTLAHEFGHAYHGHALKAVSYLNSSYSMPIAEVASIFCETLVCNAALADATPAEALSIREAQLKKSSQIIVDIYSRYLFESRLIEQRENGLLSVTDLNALMSQAQKEAYLDGLSTEHPYMWVNKGHYYNAGNNFYNFPYAYGLLFAQGLYSMYLKEGASFAKKYKDLLTATGQNNLYDVGRIVGVDVRDTAFWKGAIDVIAEEITAFEQLT